jgi:pyridoxal phosphate enzyme (YggS family)
VIGVTENFRKIQDLLAQALISAKRGPGEVRLLAASKRQAVSAVLEAARAGQRDFGENVVQEGVNKMRATGRDDLLWHFIGHLQTNKTRLVAENFAWVHTVDRLKIAERLSTQRSQGHPPLNICIQVNIDNERTKAGIEIALLPDLATAVAELPNLRLRGLMCLPAVRYSFEQQREPFRRLRELKESLNASGLNLDTLSMGMSGDFAAAIHEGATIVRLGTALFGERDKQLNVD